MKDIVEMSITDKIELLNYIRKNYSKFKNTWTSEKVEWLTDIIEQEVNKIGRFDFD
tara:strand:+ start:399 stop:566 length:168 start_codon:yes stop_codon:yes gene_type:complete